MAIFLGINVYHAHGTIIPSESTQSLITSNGTKLDDFDFSIENIEYEGMVLGSIIDLRQHDDNFFAIPSNGGQLLYTRNAVHVKVTVGNIKLSFKVYPGHVVTFASGAGNRFEFEPKPFIVNASAQNTSDVLVQFDGVEYYIPPGKRTQIVEIDIFPETTSQDYMPNIQGNTLAVIFGSAHLDVSTIDIKSLYIEQPYMQVKGKAHDLAAIVRVNDDEYPDLAVMFEDISRFFYQGVTFAKLNGKLSDGTIINGKADIIAHP